MSLDSRTESEPDFEITNARPGDGTEIGEIQKRCWLEFYPDPSVGLTVEDIETKKYGTPEQIGKWEKTIEAQGDRKQIFVAREDEKIVGYSVATKNADQHEVAAIYVQPEFHGKGVSQALMRANLDWLGSERAIDVWVLTHNAQAIRFYRKSGFEESGEASTYEINSKLIPIVKMVRKANQD